MIYAALWMIVITLTPLPGMLLLCADKEEK